jgi:S1-C subfamily serine protease
MHPFPHHGRAGGDTTQPRSRSRNSARRVTASIVAGVLALLLAAGAVVAPAHAASVTAGRGAAAAFAPGITAFLDATDATPEQSAGLVFVSTTVDFGAGVAAGTGMVIDSAGIVVTNHHVVEGATDIEVTIASTGATYTAKVLGTDATHDVAVLRLLGAPELQTVRTDSNGGDVRSEVTAVGDAGGDGGTLTAASGTVTALRQAITVNNDDGGTSRLRGLIEVDADIIPGDSGGALLDASGDVIGMNVAASSGGPDITGYVIPIRRVMRIADAVLAGENRGNVDLGYDAFLGVQLASDTGEPRLAGTVPGGPAATTGLSAGEVITALGGRSVTSTAQLRRLIASYDPGQTVNLTWADSAGYSHTAEVTLGRAPVA